MQADGLATNLPQTIVAMISSNMARSGLNCRVVVLATAENKSSSGLLMDSVIMTDNLATVHASEIDRVIGTFLEMSEIDAALRSTLGHSSVPELLPSPFPTTMHRQ